MVFPQNLPVHTRPVIEAFREPLRYDPDQIRVTGVILRQQNQVIISLFPAHILAVKSGAGRDIDLTSQNRADPLFPAFLIKIHHAVHDPVIGDRCAVHAQLLHAADVVLNLVGTVQKAVFRMCVQMNKTQFRFPPPKTGFCRPT